MEVNEDGSISGIITNTQKDVKDAVQSVIIAAVYAVAMTTSFNRM
jgi:hypothetical protein